MRSVCIRTPARLHFGLFADGRGPRKFGGVGLSISEPGFELSMRFAQQDAVDASLDSSLGPRVASLLAMLREHWDLPPIEVEFDEIIPHHVGLGSGTQLAMAVGEAAAQLMRVPATYEDLAVMLGRGARSGIGFHVYRGLEFIVDGGKMDGIGVSPVLFEAHFPRDWPVVLLHPPSPPGLFGDAEAAAFRDQVVIPAETTAKLRSLAMRGMALAVSTKNYLGFSSALFEYNRLSGSCFAGVQGGDYATPNLDALVETVRNLGCPAVGQSSWGPTLFSIHQSHDSARSFISRLGKLHPEVGVTITGPASLPIDSDDADVRLLVSVRSVEEAVEAFSGGADVIDVKEPARGSLGSADSAVRDAVIDWWNSILVEYGANDRVRLHTDLSFALGDRRESKVIDGALARHSRLATRHFWKIGFAGDRRRGDWDRWFLERCRTLQEKEEHAISSLIPAAYADADRADAPSWREIVDRICKRRPAWNYLLVDTFDKQSLLWESLGGAQGIRELFDVCRKNRILLALAGSLKIDDLDRLADEIGELPAVVAVRGAVCKDGIRTNPIDRERVAAFRRRLIAVKTRLGRNRPSCG